MYLVPGGGRRMNRELSRLIQENIDLIEQGLGLLRGLPPGVYGNNTHEFFTSGIGRHFRHVLDVYAQVLAGRQQEIDYDARKRDERVERDPVYAQQTAREMIAGLRQMLKERGGRSTVTIRTEIHDDEGHGITVESSLERELAHLASHTVHHYALIGMLARLQGVVPPDQFGLAPSTIRYLAQNS